MQRTKMPSIHKEEGVREKQVWATIGCTVATGNFENIRVELGGCKDLTDEDDPIEARRELCSQLADEVIMISEQTRRSLKRFRRREMNAA